MSNSRDSTDGALILTPQNVQRLRHACPDLGEWPEAWHVEPADILVGRQILQTLTPFLLHLLDQGLAKSTFRRHRDNLSMLGGELIRRRYYYDELTRLDVSDALQQLIEGDEAPLMWPRITESAQNSLDATARKLNRFMRDTRAAGNTDWHERHRQRRVVHGGGRAPP